MIDVLKPHQIDEARPAGRLVAEVLRTMRERAVPGVNLLQIDAWAADMIDAAGAESCYVDYAPPFGNGPFGHVICTSVNDAVLHGLPHDYDLVAGDLVSLDFAINLHGWVCDAAVSFVVPDQVGAGAGAGEGQVRGHQGASQRRTDVELVEVTERALAAGIAAVRPDGRVGDISYAIGKVLKSAGYRVNTDFGGHGVGRTMHQDPHIPNDGRRGEGVRLRPGMLLAIEPWAMAGTDELVMDPDGWTLRSANGARTAHSEHTVAVTSSGAEILTAP